MDKILIVKIGGKLINNSHVLHRFLKSFAKIKTNRNADCVDTNVNDKHISSSTSISEEMIETKEKGHDLYDTLF